MVIALAAALAAPVVCDPDRAARIVEDAGIAPDRVPATQANLIPGLARDSADARTAAAVDALCDGSVPSLAPAERWESARFSAYSFVLTQTANDPCALRQDAVVLTVGVVPGEPPRYGLRGRLPVSVTPMGEESPECEVEPSWRDEEVIEGADTAVRLVRITDHDGADTHTRVVVRRATPDGWREHVLLDPAPERLSSGGGGPTLSLSDVGGETWIVAHADRTFAEDGSCTPQPGQTVWRWTESEAEWVPSEGRDALGLLAGRGAWRLAGDDGWLLVLAQDVYADRELLKARMRRLQRRDPDPLDIVESAWFPGLNPGFLVVAPAPWATRDAAESARERYGRRTGMYVKQAWNAPNSCEDR